MGIPFRRIILITALVTCNLSAEQPQQFDYQSMTLPNGLQVVSLEDFSCPIVAVHLWYHVGSKDEQPERQGFAHMFEHMMFRGTDRLGSTDHFDLIRKTGGNCNAYTTFDQTVYTQSLPANQLNLALWLEAERMSMLKIDQKAFDTERKVVEEERRLGVNQPYGKLLEKVLPVLFPDHPYQWSTIGSIPHLRSASVPELRDFWTRYYIPNNATLVVVGAVKHGEVQQLAKRNFGWIPKGPDPPRVALPSADPLKTRTVTIQEKNAPAPLLGLLFRGVPLSHPDAEALDLMTTILGGGESSRIYRRVVADDQTAVLALGANLGIEQNGAVLLGAVLPPIGGKSDKVLGAMKEEVRRMQTEPVSAAELAKARNQMLRSIVTESLTVESKASALGAAAVLEHDVARINSRLDRIRAVTPDDIMRVAGMYTNLDHAVTGIVKPNLLGTLSGLLGVKANVEDVPITGVAETSPPPPGRPGVTRPTSRVATSPLAGLLQHNPSLDFSEAVLDNGMHLVVVENHEVPFVSVTLGLETGAWTENKPGTASMAFSMLTKGTANHSEEELSSELETYAISLTGNGGMDSSSVSLSCLPEHIERGMGLLADTVRTPTMPENEFKKLVRQTRTGMMISNKQPAYIADREFRRRLFGDHPYARAAAGELEDIKALKREDLNAWWHEQIRPQVSTLIFAGDINMKTARELANNHFGDWKVDGDATRPELPELPTPSATHIYLVDNRGVQSQIRVGHLGMTRTDPDDIPGRVMSGYFGGAFSSRLNETIRIKKGLTYGASGGFSSSKRAGEFRISTFSKNASTVEAVQSILDEVKRLRTEAPSEKELGNTISYKLGSFPSDRETPQQVAADIWFTQSNELRADYFEQYLAGVATTTADDCLKVAQERVDEHSLIIVVVGPAKKLAEGLRKIAPLTVVE